MKEFLVKNKDIITTVCGAVPAAATTGYQAYEMTMGVGGNGVTIILSVVMALVSWFTGKTPQK